MRIIVDFMNMYPQSEIVKNISRGGLDVVNNRIYVGLRDYTEEAIYLFRKTVTDSSAVTFKELDWTPDWITDLSATEAVDDYVSEVDLIQPMSTTINPGMAINVPFGSIFSMGYRARTRTIDPANSLHGFVTVAHTVREGNTIRAGSTNIGTVTPLRQISGSIDAAFVELNSNVTATNTFHNATAAGLNTHVRQEFTRGDFVGKVGWATHMTIGVIENASTFFPVLGVTIQEQVFVQNAHPGHMAADGDSGGVVFWIPHGTPSISGNFAVAGIVVGGRRGGAPFMYFTRADRINQAFVLTRH
jgi:hypothetical protein